MLKRILLVQIALICNIKVTEAVEIGNGFSFDVNYLADKKQI